MILTVVSAILCNCRRSLKKVQDFNGIWTRDLVISVWCSNQLSYKSADVRSWSKLLCVHVFLIWFILCTVIYHTLYWGYYFMVRKVSAVRRDDFIITSYASTIQEQNSSPTLWSASNLVNDKQTVLCSVCCRSLWIIVLTIAFSGSSFDSGQNQHTLPIIH